MIERISLFVCLMISIVVLLVTGFVLLALAPHLREIGDMLYDTLRVVYIFTCIAGGIGLLELWAIVKHHREMLEIRREKAWLDSQVGGLPGELFYAGEKNITHISAIKEAAPMMSYENMMQGHIGESQNSMVQLFDEGISPKQIAEGSKKSIGYVYRVLEKHGRKV